MLSNGLLRLWENPEVLQLNKLPGRATFELFPTAAVAAAGAKNPWRLSLDGTWDFCTFDDITLAESVASGAGSADWKTIQVPGHPELQGFGNPHYTNVQMPYRHDPPKVPGINPTGVFRKVVNVPKTWKGQRVVLHFGSAESLLAVWINGQPVGLSKGSRLPAEFDVTALAAAGKPMEITALTAKWSDANFIEDQDMWWMSGLPRSVFLQAMPPVFIEDLAVRPTVTSQGCELEVEVRMGYLKNIPEGARVQVQLRDPKGRPMFRKPLEAAVSWARNLHSELSGVALLNAKVPGAKLWSAESPVLYRVEVSASSGESSCFTSLRTGFRSVRVENGSLLVNGRRVLIFGVNRHSHDERTGRAVSRERMKEDILLMKRFHFNAVRCSHYPPDPYWFELCDEYGLYVIDEADAESHDFHNSLCWNPRYATAWLDRVMRMVQRDRNHPSIILWSLGNESGFGPNHCAAAAWVRHADPSRPLHYEGAISLFQSRVTFLHGQVATDINCPMYTSIEDLRKMEAFLDKVAPKIRRQSSAELIPLAAAAVPMGKGERPLQPVHDPVHPADRPIILCEYSHAMGNSNGCLSDYFELFRNSRRIQGGFIWEWCDHGVLRKLPNGREEYAYGGDFGDTPNDANFCCDGLVGPDRSLHPAVWEHRHLAQPLEVTPDLQLINRQSFTSTEWISGTWEIVVDGKVLRKGRLTLPVLGPGERKKLRIPHGKLPPQGEGLLNVFFHSKSRGPVFAKGEEIGSWQIQLSKNTNKPRFRDKPAKVTRVEAAESDGKVEVHAGQAKLVFESCRSLLTDLEWNGTPLLVEGPRAALWRAATDNDGIKLWSGQDNKPLGRWLKLGLDRMQERPKDFQVSRERSGAMVVTTVHALSGRERWEDFLFTSVFRITGEGIHLSHKLSLGSKDLEDLPRIGCTWRWADTFGKLRYFGLGPHENYPDRRSCVRLGAFEFEPSTQWPPYVMPQEFGLHGEMRSIELVSAAADVRIEPAKPLHFSALPFTAGDLFAARHRSDLQPRAEVVLTLDVAHRGVGTASCGPDTLPQYRISGREFGWDYLLKIA